MSLGPSLSHLPSSLSQLPRLGGASGGVVCAIAGCGLDAASDFSAAVVAVVLGAVHGAIKGKASCSTFANGATGSKTRGQSSLACRARSFFLLRYAFSLQFVEQYTASSRTISGIGPAHCRHTRII